MHISSAFRSAILIVAAMLGGAVVLVIILTATHFLTLYARVPADVLEAEGTIAVFHDMQPPAFLGDRFPVLVRNGAESTALTGTLQDPVALWFWNKETHPEMDGTDAGPFIVAQSNESKPALEPAFSLARSEPYRLYAATMQNTPWVYLQRSMLPEPATLFDRILFAGLFPPSVPALGIGQTPSGWSLLRPAGLDRAGLRPAGPAHARLTAEPRPLQGAFAMLSLAEPLRVWERLQNAENGSLGPILEGLLRQSVRTIFGSTASMQYDVLPLFAKPSTLQLSTSGAVSIVLLEGSVADAALLPEQMNTLHASFRTDLPTASTVRRVLDDRFTSTDIRDDPAVILESQTIRGAWTVRATQHREHSTGLFTAVYDTSFLISNNEAVLLAALTTEPVKTAALTAAGMIDRSALAEYLSSRLPQAAETSLPLPAGVGLPEGTLKWQTRLFGPVSALELTGEPKDSPASSLDEPL